MKHGSIIKLAAYMRESVTTRKIFRHQQEGNPVLIKKKMTVRSEQGLHARPADLFVHTANRFHSQILVCNLTSGTGPVNAKSILRVLALGVYNGHRIEISAEGGDEKEAMAAISRLVETNFKGQQQKEVV